MYLKTSLIILLLLVTTFCDARRSRGRSRGSSSGSSTFWTRKNKSGSEQKQPVSPPKPVVTQPKPVSQPKPSAPKEPELKKENSNLQQSSPQNSRPIGWDVDKNGPQKQNVNPSYTAPNPHNAGYPQGAAYPNSGVYPQNTGGYSGYGYGQPSGGYPNNGYGSHGAYQGQSYGNAYNPQTFAGQNPGYNPQGFSGQNPGYYQNNMGGYGGYGGNPHMPQQQSSGVMGSLFGGNKQGYGGYGGHGGYGGYGGHGGYGGYGGYGGGFGGYGMKKSGGFFGKHAFRNVMGGLFVWYLVSGLVSRPYKVYNYYNQPKEVREEITLPANVLTLCNENATNICVPGTIAICTQDNRILCVSSMSSASPCQDKTGELCVNSTIPCEDANDPLCQNKTTTDNTTTVNLPCFTNMTVQTGSASLPPNVTLPVSEDNKFCVTTMAMPDPSIPVDDGKAPEINLDKKEAAPPYGAPEGSNATLPIKL